MRFVLSGLMPAMLLYSSAAQAEWTRVATDATGSVWLMDSGRITTESNHVHAWVKIDASKDSSVTYRQSLRLYSSICSSKKMKLLSAANYDSYGKLIQSNDYPDYYSDVGYKYVTPDSMGETVLEISCAIGEAKRQ